VCAGEDESEKIRCLGKEKIGGLIIDLLYLFGRVSGRSPFHADTTTLQMQQTLLHCRDIFPKALLLSPPELSQRVLVLHTRTDPPSSARAKRCK